MMRAWTQSAARARCYAPARIRQGALRTRTLQLVWLRRLRTNPHALSLHVRARLHVTLAGGARERHTLLRLSAERHTRALRVVSSRHHSTSRETMRLLATGADHRLLMRRDGATTRVLMAPPAVESSALTAEPHATRRLTTRHERALTSLLTHVRATAVQHLLTSSVRVARIEARTVLERTLHRDRWLKDPPRRTRQADDPQRGETGRANTMTRAPTVRVELPVARAGARTTMPVQAFSAQPQPLPAAPVRAAAAVPQISTEHIERTVRESMTSVVERTIRHELNRTLSPGSAVSRKLRESIQSELYDDIVFERERLS